MISGKKIHRMAIPALITGISEPALSLADTAIIGNVDENSVAALAAVGIIGSLMSALMWVFGQTRFSLAAIIASHWGAKNLKAIKTLPAQMAVFMFFVGAFISVVSIFFVSEILSLYNATGMVKEMASRYYVIRIVGLPISILLFNLYGVFAGCQNTLIPMIISVTGVLMNIVLSIIMVHGIDGWIPAMHIDGAAYATVISQLLMLGIGIYYFVKKTSFILIPMRKPHPYTKKVLMIALNLCARTLAIHFALYVSNAQATSYGKEYIAAHSIVFQIWFFLAFLSDGYATVISILGGRFKGMNDWHALKDTLRKVNLYALMGNGLLTIVCFIIYTGMGRIFTGEQIVLEKFGEVFWIVLLFQPLNTIAFNYEGMYKGTAWTQTLRNSMLTSTIVFFVPALFICNYLGLKLVGIWISFSIWMIVRYLYININFSKRIRGLLAG